MYSLRTIVIVLVTISTLSIGIDLVSESEELKEGKVNLLYVGIALATSMVALVFLAFFIMFIKYVWMWYTP